MNSSKLFFSFLILTTGNCLELNAAPFEVTSKESAENAIELWLPKKPWAAILDRIINVNPPISIVAKLFNKSVKLTNSFEKYGVDSKDPIAKKRLKDSFKYCIATVLLIQKIASYLEFTVDSYGKSVHSLKPEFVKCLTSNTPSAQEKFKEIFKSEVTDDLYLAATNPLYVAMLIDQAILLMNNKAHDGYFLPDFDLFFEDIFNMLAIK